MHRRSYKHEEIENAIVMIAMIGNLVEVSSQIGISVASLSRWNIKYRDRIEKIREENLEKLSKQYLRENNYLGMKNALEINKRISKKIEDGEISVAVEMMNKTNAYAKSASDAIRLANNEPTEKVSADITYEDFVSKVSENEF